MKGPTLSLAAIPRRHPRLLAAVGVVCVLAAVVGYFVWRGWQADRYQREAQQAINDRDFARAKTSLLAYLAIRPNAAKEQFLLAQVYRRARVEDFAAAHQRLDKAADLGMTGLEAALESVILAFQQDGAPGKQENLLRQYLDSGGPEEPLVLEALARGCINNNRLDEANGWLNQWVERAPDDWYPHLWRGALFEYNAKANYALADYQFVLKKKPGDEEIRRLLGLMLVQSGYDFETALRYLESYQRGHPDNADVLVGIARCQRALQQPEAAQTLLAQVVAAHPDDYDALLTLAEIKADHGDDLEALRLLRQAEPLARQYHEMDDLKRLSRLDPPPNHADASHRTRAVLNLRGSVLERLGRDAEAQRCRAEVEQIAADSTDLQNTLRERKQRPHDLVVLHHLCDLYLRLGLTELRESCLRKILHEKPDDQTARRALAEASQEAQKR